MTRFTTTTTALAALLATTTIASAGGVERSAQSMGILFEEGTYAELSFSTVDPDVSGTAGGGALASGDMLTRYNQFELRYHQDLSEELSFSLIVDSPIGADVAYPEGTGYPLAGANGTINSHAVSAILRYELEGGFSVYGGLRAVTAEGNVTLPGYRLDAQGSTELGYLVGAAYERPDIALRVSLTYQSATDHEFDSVESGLPGTFPVTIPQSLTLEAQSGVAENTLVFGSIRWVDWSEFSIAPPFYPTELVGYDDDTFTYTIGGARRLNDQWALLASIAYEAQNGGFSGNLGPTDGRTTIGLGARYDNGPWRISGGVSYSLIGDAETENPAVPGATLGTFTDNSALGFGLRVGYTF